MEPVQFILWSSAFLWLYALVMAVAWFRAVGQEETETHVGHFVSLMGVLVPVIALSVLIVLFGGTLGIPWIVFLLPLTLPGGLVVALQLEVSRLWEPTLRTELSRLGTALALTIISASVTR
ncbi:MAG: hypothetical protein AAFV31_09125 [Pseudomonadota bacterium]